MTSKAPKLKEGKPMSTISIRYMIDDVPAAIKFYTTHLGFSLDLDASPAFASAAKPCPTAASPFPAAGTGFRSKWTTSTER
jgi:catechol 2,3-dioxygenase-like lactoylglutathione lyase family enzyme